MMWKTARLGDLCTKVGSGATPRGGKESYKDSGIALIRSQNVYNNRFVKEGLAFIDDEQATGLANVEIEPDDVLLNITGDSVARVCQVPSEVLPARVNQHVATIRPDPSRLDPGFLRYWLVSPGTQAYMLALASAGATRKALTKGMIEGFEIPLPSLVIQRRIGHILGSLDDKIELNRRMNRTLEAIARAIFKSWFIDFDPVHAKAEGREPVGMDPETAALFPDSFQDSPLGKIPRGWEVSTVGDEFRLTMGQSPPGSTYNEEGDGLPFFQGRRDFGFRYPTKRVFCTAPKRIAEAGDTLVSVRAPVGDVNMALEQLCVGRGLAGVRHVSDSRSYTYYAMLSLRSRFREYESEGTVFGAINKGQFSGLEWVAPGAELIEAFESRLCAVDETIRLNVLESMKLASVRDTLLPKLISGDLRVKDAEWSSGRLA